ncbi:MAG: hypothetical protein LBD55_12205 [Treponema sp.]|nr:hypothetical protein [Treponema sp.]
MGDTKTPWMIIADVDIYVVLAPVYGLIRFTVIFAIIAFIFTLGLVYLLINQTVKPIITERPGSGGASTERYGRTGHRKQADTGSHRSPE